MEIAAERRASAASSPLVPLAIVGYAVLLLVQRLSFSAALEVDEAQFVGHVDWRLVYENSHPPLYNWILRLLLEASGWSWALAVAVTKYTLLAAYHLLTWDAARRLGGPQCALLALAASAFLPQVVWMPVHTLAHSVMVLACVAATVHAAVLVIQTGRRAAYLWLGLAMAAGVLAKYNYLLFLVPFAVAALTIGELRAAVLSRRAAWAVVPFVAIVTPVLIAAVREIGASTARMAKLYRAEGTLPWYDVPGLGLDGLVSLALALLEWAGPAALVWAIARWRDRRSGSTPGDAPPMIVRALGLTMVAGFALSALAVLAGDMHKVQPRYLTPLLAPLALWLALAWPLRASGRSTVGLAAALYIAAPIGHWGMVTFDQHRYRLDHTPVVDAIRALAGGPVALFARREDDRANLILALAWPGAASPTFAPPGDRAVLVWRGREPRPADVAPAGFAPSGEVRTVVAPFRNRAGGSLTYNIQALVLSSR